MILETERLYLRQFQMEDAKRFSEYRNKREVARYQSWNSYSIFDARRRMRYCIKHPEIKGNNQFAIVLKENDYIIGDIFIDTSLDNSFVLGYTLDSEYWHHGYAYEMTSAFIDYMKELGYTKAVAYVITENYRSVHLLEKLGFEEVYRLSFNDEAQYAKEL